MTTYLCVAIIIVALVLLFGNAKAALLVGLTFSAGGFGYRLYVGEEIRAVVADALFVVALLPLGWWAQKQFEATIASLQPADLEDCPERTTQC